MKQVTTPLLPNNLAEAQLLGSGCTGCWAAGYCAAYLPTSLQPPLACPLTLSEAERGGDRKTPARD
jgi:hypothetical protein